MTLVSKHKYQFQYMTTTDFAALFASIDNGSTIKPFTASEESDGSIKLLKPTGCNACTLNMITGVRVPTPSAYNPIRLHYSTMMRADCDVATNSENINMWWGMAPFLTAGTTTSADYLSAVIFEAEKLAAGTLNCRAAIGTHPITSWTGVDSVTVTDEKWIATRRLLEADLLLTKLSTSYALRWKVASGQVVKQDFGEVYKSDHYAFDVGIALFFTVVCNSNSQPYYKLYSQEVSVY